MKVLVAYFSAGGATAQIAARLTKSIGADVFEIKPAQRYSKDDLDWQNPKSRSSMEMNDKTSRPAIAEKKEDMSEYDVIFLGFPIWWYREPSIIDTFIESYDFSGKIIVPFATSGGSELNDTSRNLQALAKGAVVTTGKRFDSSAGEDELADWAKEWI
ncbi:flavodoxin [Butyrivibrio sp. VCD2006]|uniref:flavodoxin n=1 Tax=Butyrivibrio sp. VCD2006 TaxID=1280664 RepID=UPI00041E8FB3|nr:flavodoxin [Butyrivibrio sp. VCD2006]